MNENITHTIRRLMRSGRWDTVDIADALNRMGRFEDNQNRAWRESDVWNLLSGDRPPIRSLAIPRAWA